MFMRFLPILIICTFSSLIKSQELTSFGVLPKLSFATKVNDQFKLVNSIATRHLSYNGETFNYEYVLTELVSFVSYKIQSDQKINFGYTLRRRDGVWFHRLSEHYNFISRTDQGRLGHRIALDQTFANQKDTEFRIRYRLTLEKSLSGTKVDAKEFYFKMGNEYLYALKKEKRQFEIRLVPQLGYEINRTNKIETGIDYRLKDVFSDNTTSNIWLSLTWYTRIK